MNPVPDSWFALVEYNREIIVLLACMLWGSIITIAGLRTIKGLRLSLSETISLALGGWVVPTLPASILIIGFSILFKVQPGMVVPGILMFVSLCLAVWWLGRVKITPVPEPSLYPAILVLFFIVSIFLRLAFIAHLLLPPYFDSAEHYRIIQSLVAALGPAGAARPFTWPVPSYYHLGFHIIAAVLTAIFHLNIRNMILVSGQIMLAVVPIPLFLIVRQVTRSNLAALFAVLLAAFGWYMPAFSMNWGKYPALLSLLPVEFTLGFACLAVESKMKPGRFGGLFAMVLLGVCVSFLIHTRSIIILGMIGAAWTLAQAWERQPKIRRYLLLGCAMILLIGESILIARDPILAPLLDPYFHGGVFVTGLVGLFSVAAFWKYPRLAFSALLAILLLLAGLFVPVPIFTYTTLLDRPLVEMILFLPLAVLGGAGCAGLIDLLHTRPHFIKEGLQVALLGLLSFALVFHAFIAYSFSPSACCSIVTRDDLVALDWLDSNLPINARILISASDFRFSISPPPFQVVAGDAGAWILPLTGRQTLSLLYGTNFARPETLELICARGVKNIYVGSTGQSFNPGSLDEKPDWYKLLLFLPQAKVYQVTGCAN